MMAGGDARDRLGQMAKTTDARAKLTKIKNLKQGKVSNKVEMANEISHGSPRDLMTLEVYASDYDLVVYCSSCRSFNSKQVPSPGGTAGT